MSLLPDPPPAFLPRRFCRASSANRPPLPVRGPWFNFAFPSVEITGPRLPSLVILPQPSALAIRLTIIVAGKDICLAIE